MHRYLKLALKEIDGHIFDEHLSFRLCAILVRGGQILSIGFNHGNRNGFVTAYSGKRWFTNTHAEMAAILQVRSKIDLRGTKIYVARRTRSDLVGLAKPCPLCENVLYQYGIKRAYYTINERTYGVMNVAKYEQEKE
jgi:tRNA(Arg) A34 adenosine deaminase TadA